MADSRELIFNLLGKETVSSAAKKAERGLEDLGDEFKDADKAAKKLDRQIRDNEKSLHDLAVAFANTGNTDFFKKMREGEKELRGLKKSSKLISGLGEDIAEGASITFRQKFGSLIASGPGVAVAGTVLGLAMAPTLGAALAGAVVGGAGIGGVVGGLILAAKNPAVASAGKVLGTQVSTGLEESAQVFVQPALRGIALIGKGFKDIRPQIDRIFGVSSRFVEPLVSGAVSGAKKLVEGVADAVVKARPIVNSLSRSFDSIGGAIGDVFSLLADDADEGASAIDDLTYAMTNLIRVSGDIIHTTAQVKGYTDQLDVALDKGRYWFEDNSALAKALHNVGIELDTTADGFSKNSPAAEAYRNATLGVASAADFATLKAAGMTDAQIAAADASGNFERNAQTAATAGNNLGSAQDYAARAARGQSAALDEVATKLQEQTDPMFNLINKQRDLSKAQKDYNEAVKEHGRNSPQAKDALLKSASAAIALQGAVGSAAGAFNGALTPAMKATLRSAGFTEGQIKDLEAQFKTAYAAGNKFAQDYKASANLQDNATPKAKWIQKVINGLHGKTVTVAVKYETHGSAQGEHIIGHGTQLKNRWGGLYEKAQTGLLREASTYSATNPGRYMIAEPATGGEAFIPKNGNAARSTSILQKAASWYGKKVVDPNELSFAKALLTVMKKGKGVLYEDMSWSDESTPWKAAWDEDSLRYGLAEKLDLDFRKPAEIKKKLEAYLSKITTTPPKPAAPAPSASNFSVSGEQVIRIIVEGTGVLTGLRKEIRVRGGNVQAVLGA